MALATRCPSCHALFRVVADQLKLRGGLVRCGACAHVFDAIGTLSYLDDASLRPVVSPTESPATEGRSALTLQIPPSDARPEPADAESGSPLPSGQPTTTGTDIGEDALTAAADTAPVPDVVGLVDAESPESIGEIEPAFESKANATAAPEANGEIEASRGSAIDSAEADDAADQAAAAKMEDAAPEAANELVDVPLTDAAAFLQEAPAARRKSVTIAYAAGATMLCVALVLQLAFFFRAELAAQWPAARPALATACEWAGCAVGWPNRGEMLAVVGSELQSLPGTSALELMAVVRNRAAVTIALPAIEVTLTDTQNRAVARRIFAPSDYLAASEAAARLSEGLEAGADMTVRIFFEVRGVSAAGFVVYPFYL